jgi:hypothetical protein
MEASSHTVFCLTSISVVLCSLLALQTARVTSQPTVNTAMNTHNASGEDASLSSLEKKRYLCLTILGYRRPDMTSEDMRYHMTQVSAPMTKGLMVKYGVMRWTQIHNTDETRELTTYLFDRQMPNVADYDVFSQCVFEDLDGYKRMKEDPWYKEHLVGDHEKFADTKRTK